MNANPTLMPISGKFNSTWVKNVADSTLLDISWSLFGLVPGYTNKGLVASMTFCDSTGFVLAYSYVVASGVAALEICPESTSQSNYSTPSTMYYYSVNPANGKPLNASKLLKSAAYNVATRPWYWAATQTTSPIFSQPLASPTSGYTIYALAQQFGSGINVGYLQVGLTINFLSTFLASLNTQGTAQVAYIMTTINPTGLLLGSTTSEFVNATSYAVNAKNTVIRNTARYIQANMITSDTTEYVSELGCLLSVQFWTYGSPTTVYTPPPASGFTYAPSTGGLAWTVVSCNTQYADPTTTTTYQVNNGASYDDYGDDDDGVNNNVVALGGVSVAILVILILSVIGFAIFAYNVSNRDAAFVAGQGKTAEMVGNPVQVAAQL